MSKITDWVDQLASNDADHGRDSADNPNNQPNGG